MSDRDAQEIQSLVIHRDDWVIALDKPSGLAVQGGSGTERHVDGMLDALRFGFEERPRLVHRLDKDTSGLLLIARTGQAAKRLSEVVPRPRDREALLGGRGRRAAAARRRDRPAARQAARARATARPCRSITRRARRRSPISAIMDRAASRAALLALWPRTGRTHQLRVHCAEIGCPILGDRKYGGEEALLSAVADSRRLHLHARRITLPHPSGKGTLRVQAELPPHFRRTVEAFGFSTTGD